MKYDFIAIGDVVTDAFIHLLPESAHLVKSGAEPELCFLFGEKVPFGEAIVIPAVGNSANAAVSAARLGLSTAFITNIGSDRAGEETVARLASESVGTEYVISQKGKVSNYHYVLWYGDDRTILIKHEAYEYHLPAMEEEPRWIYFSSIGEGALRFHDEVVAYMQTHPTVKLAFQPGTFQIKQGAKGLADVYKFSEIIMCNREEAQAILGIQNPDIKTLMVAMHTLGPKIVVITDGVKGAYASQNGTILFMRNYPDPKPPYERTGAGDAFSSTLVVALALGHSLEEALTWAPINSMSVVQYVGAQEGLLRKSVLERYLASAPADYKPVVFAKL